MFVDGTVQQIEVIDLSASIPCPPMEQIALDSSELFVVVYAVDDDESFRTALLKLDWILENKKGIHSKKVLSSQPVEILKLIL